MIKDNKILKYGIKKLSFGIVSIAVGAVIFLSGDASAHEEILTKDSGNIEKVTSKNSVSITEKNNISKDYNIKSSNKLGIEETKEELKIEKNLPKKTELNTNISNISEIEIIKNKNGITGSNSLNHNLNVIDKRVDDSSDIASLLTKVINKNSEENKVIPETVENTEEFVEKGTKIISRLTSKYAEDIARGYIGLEGGKYDSLIYKKAVLNPDGDDDGDGITNKDELYIYKKDGRTYLGYDIHPRLADTDGDGLNDKVDKDKLIWNISARDMAMFINLVYENDKKIDDILRKQAPVEKLSNNIQKMANNELGPYWRVKETYHQDNGLDAVLFETTNNFPFLKGDKIQVLAFAGTNVKQAGDLKADLALFFGNESNQSEAAIQLMKKIKSDSTITNLYITGHSLGGYLSLRATATAEKDKFGKYKQTYTFNAPKVKSGWFWGVPKDDVKISEELAKTGKIKNYYTDNDNIIPGNLQPSNKISIGRSAGAHSSTSYFESRVNSNSAFNFGKRQGMDGVGYRDENINKLSIIDPEKGTLSKTFLPTLVDDKPVSIMIGEKIKDRDVLNKINRDLLPVNIKLTVVSTDELTTLGLKHARVKVSYLDDNTSNNINVPIFVTEADKKELISVVNAAKKLVESVVDLSDKTVKSVENYNRAKYNLTKKLEEAATTVSSSLTPQLVINNITKEVANLGMSVINTRAALELTEAGKYEPRVINDEQILLHRGSSINLDTVINKIFKDNIPQNTNYEILNSTEFGELGDIVAKVKVTYSDNSFDIVNIPIRIYTDSKGDSLIQEENPELVISEKGESLVQEENPELVISEKGEALVQEENPELVISEKGESLVQEENLELVISEKGEPLVQEENPELVISEKGEALVQKENPELVISEKGESLVKEENPELVISEKGESLIKEENPELVISEKGESLVQEEKPSADIESLKTKNLGVEVELLSNIKNISLNVKVVKNSKQLTSISKTLSVEKDKVRVLDLKLTKNASVLNLNNKRIVRIALLENESNKINIYHVEKNGKLTFVSSEVKNKVVQFNIDHFSLFAIVDFSKTIKNNEKNEQKQIISESKKQQKSSTDIKDRINIGNEILNSKTIKMSNLNEKKEKIDNNLFKNGRIVSENIIESNNNFKQISILPKTGDSSSSRLPIVVEVGLIIGVLGIRKYNR
ncbi:Rib/alpha-like domain-containing protein [Gemella parahaemolysans]